MRVAAQTNRLYYLDWLRVLAFGLLIPYHAGLIFVDWGFHIQNERLTEDLKLPMLFVNQWRLPLLFFISGVGTRLALNRRPPGVYVRDRLRRLLIPLIAGILLVIPPQVYFERLNHGTDYQSYWSFYPHFFEIGNFTWNHLWFVVYLLTYSLALVPLFLSLRQRGNNLGKASFLTNNYGLLWLTLPLLLTELLLRSAWPDTRNLVADWYNFTFYILCLIYGFYLSLHEQFWPRIEKNRGGYLAGGIIAFNVIYWGWHAPGEGFLETTTVGWLFFRFFKCLNIWCWLLCFIGFSRYYLQKGNSFLQYTNEAVYPFYILHQTVLIGIGYYIIQWPASIGLKYAAIVGGTFLGTVLLYEFMIRRFALFRLLFGLKSSRTNKVVP
ncbi:MAG: acyltransferase family protein [Ferruginibacter sp.]|nr:acyltransferase family protein [Cytophagales bacterium]